MPVSPVSSPSKTGLFLNGRTPGTYYQAPVLNAEVQLAVTGTIIRATVRQLFYNPSSQWLEGIYVFPLPERSGVDRLRMQIGDRDLEDQIQEKAEAQQTYERAGHRGNRATLVSRTRDNLFTTRVANVGPEEEIKIEIQYGDAVRFTDHVYSLRFPMVVAPRYTPGQVGLNNQGGGGARAVADEEAISFPIHDPLHAMVPGGPLRYVVSAKAKKRRVKEEKRQLRGAIRRISEIQGKRAVGS